MLVKNHFVIGFIHFTEDGQEEYLEKYFTHEYSSHCNDKQLEGYLIRKYEKIVAKEYDVNIDCLCISKFMKL